MKNELVNKKEIKLVGLSARTNNKNEMDSQNAKIGKLLEIFGGQGIADKIPGRKNPGVTLAVYTEYTSDEHGDYTYFIGEEVDSYDNVPADLQQLTIPAAAYQKFTTPPGKMPDIVIAAWQQIWQMTANDFGGKRAYRADFEVYDDRAYDPAKTIVDIYIGLSSDK
jgi:predicted transcriptional regulator YdeE